MLESEKIKFELVPYTRGRILDVGCGLQKVYARATGVDRIPQADIVADIRNMSMLASESWDTVFSSFALHEMLDPGAALREWWRLVKVGGHLAIYWPDPHTKPAGIECDLDQETAISIMDEIGEYDLVTNETRSGFGEYGIWQVYRKQAPGRGCFHSWCLPRHEKTAGIVRNGAYGDALWGGSVAWHLKDQGYHVTVYTGPKGEEVLRHDPNIDRIIVQEDDLFTQTEMLGFWFTESEKYSKWVNLVGTAEIKLLPTVNELAFHWPDSVRHAEMDRNYVEVAHDMAGVPRDGKQRFYPNDEEIAWALEERSKYDGPVVILNHTGSSVPKWWPYAQEFMEILADEKIHTFVVGDSPKPLKPVGEYGHVVGLGWPIRRALAFALLADAVVGTESVFVNAVAYEQILKVVFLSHSSHENLTKNWARTVAVKPSGLDCYPCHRIHNTWHFCFREKETGAAACQAIAKPGAIAEVVLKYLETRDSIPADAKHPEEATCAAD